MRSAHKIFVGRREGKVLLGRRKRRWEDDIRMGLKEVGWKGPAAGPSEHSNIPSGSMKDGESF
jgi:hypothetical protein